MGGLLTALTPFAAYAVSQFKARAVLQLKTTTRLKIIIKTLKIHQRGKVVGDIGGGQDRAKVGQPQKVKIY